MGSIWFVFPLLASFASPCVIISGWCTRSISLGFCVFLSSVFIRFFRWGSKNIEFVTISRYYYFYKKFFFFYLFCPLGFNSFIRDIALCWLFGCCPELVIFNFRVPFLYQFVAFVGVVFWGAHFCLCSAPFECIGWSLNVAVVALRLCQFLPMPLSCVGFLRVQWLVTESHCGRCAALLLIWLSMPLSCVGRCLLFCLYLDVTCILLLILIFLWFIYFFFYIAVLNFVLLS